MGLFSREHGTSPQVVGAVVRHRALGTQALYEVLSEEEGGSVLTVAVLDAPGLAAGSHVRLMRNAVAAMELVEAPRGAGELVAA